MLGGGSLLGAPHLVRPPPPTTFTVPWYHETNAIQLPLGSSKVLKFGASPGVHDHTTSTSSTGAISVALLARGFQCQTTRMPNQMTTKPSWTSTYTHQTAKVQRINKVSKFTNNLPSRCDEPRPHTTQLKSTTIGNKYAALNRPRQMYVRLRTRFLSSQVIHPRWQPSHFRTIH
jgi:hypothetical protein